MGEISSIYKWRHTPADKTQPSPKALEDRKRRQAMPDTRDNTGRLLGDPPPGRSALDMKRAASQPQPTGWVSEYAEDIEDNDNE